MKKVYSLILVFTLILTSVAVAPSVSFAETASYFPLTFDNWQSVDKNIIEWGGISTSSDSVELSNEGRSGKALKLTQATTNSKWRFKDAFKNLSAGETYVVSMYVKSVEKSGNVSLGIYRDSNPNPVSALCTSTVSPDTWVRLKGMFTVDSSTLDITKIGIIQSNTADEMIGAILVDDVNIVKATEGENTEINTERITNYNFDGWNSTRLATSFTIGGEQPYEGVKLSIGDGINDSTALSVGQRTKTYNRFKLMNVAKHPSAGSTYKYTAYVKIGEASNLESAKINMGVCDLDISAPVFYTDSAVVTKNGWTKIEFTYTLKSDTEGSISFEQSAETGVLTEYLIDDLTVELLYRNPEFNISVTESNKGYSINTNLEYYCSEDNKSLSFQPVVAKYNASGLLDVKIFDKTTFNNDSVYPFNNTYEFETDKLLSGEFIKAFPMAAVASLLPYLHSYKYDPNDPEFDQKTLYLIGDSIVTDYSSKLDKPTRGWGMYIGEYFNESNIKVKNNAIAGYSTKSFLQTAGISKWNDVKKNAKKGDYVMICLGINDASSSNLSVKTTIDEYKANLQKFIDDLSGRGVTMVFLTLTPTVGSSAPIKNLRRERADAMIEVLESNNASQRDDLYILDLNKTMFEEMETLVDSMGYDNFKAEYFSDTTHQTEKGSRWVLSFIMDLLSKTDCSLNNYRKTEN